MAYSRQVNSPPDYDTGETGSSGVDDKVSKLRAILYDFMPRCTASFFHWI